MKFFAQFFLRFYDYTVLYLSLLVFGLLCLSWSLLAAVLFLILPKKIGSLLGRFAIMLIFRFFLACMALSGRFLFDLRALDALKREKSLIIAPNHPSLWDVVLIVSRLPDVTCIMKAEIVGNIFFGGGSRLAGYIRNASTRQMIMQSVRNLDQASHLLLFPEGTRTMRRPIGPLKGSIGAIAGRAHVPVQTILIETNSPFLSKGWPVYKVPQMPVTFTVRLGRRFDVVDNSAAFMTELAEYFSSELDNQVAKMEASAVVPASMSGN